MSESFDEPTLGFSLRIPDCWEFTPPAWTPSTEPRIPADGSWAWIKANQPFCAGRRWHQSTRHAFPSLQVTARALQLQSEAQANALLDMQLGVLSRVYGQFDVREASADALIDGHRSIVIRGSFSVNMEVEGEQLPIWMLSRLYVVFAPGRAFTLGLSSDLDESYYFESDFEQILESVRITG